MSGPLTTLLRDVHREGLFPKATWLRLLEEAGLSASCDYRFVEGVAYETFVAVRPR